MIGIIVAGHGNFPTGIMSAVSLIAGNPEHIKAVDFVKGMSSQELKQKLEEQMEAKSVVISPPSLINTVHSQTSLSACLISNCFVFNH